MGSGDRHDTDLHDAFSAPGDTRFDDRLAFLSAVDRLPGITAIRAEMRRLAAPPAGGVLVDAGCGPGLETERLAAAFPDVTVVGVDHDRDALASARTRATAGNLRWVEGDLAALDLVAAPVHVVRTERVLIYVDDLAAAVASVSSVLRPGGVFAAFELDYGATLLPPLGRAPDVIRRMTDCLERSLPQPWAGRRLPEICAAHGLEPVAVQPCGFTVDHPVWSRIVADTLRTARSEGRLDEPALDGWIAELDHPDEDRFRAAINGVLTVARRR